MCAARLNVRDGVLSAEVGEAIEQAAGEVADGKLMDHFPLKVFQTYALFSSALRRPASRPRKEERVERGRGAGARPASSFAALAEAHTERAGARARSPT